MNWANSGFYRVLNASKLLWQFGPMLVLESVVLSLFVYKKSHSEIKKIKKGFND
jgi:hypothetical protein